MADAPRTPDLAALHRLAYAQDGLFTSRQALSCEISAQLLSHHARTGRFERVRRGLYRLADYPAGEHAAIRAAWLAVGAHRAVVSHQSALALHGLLDTPTATVHLLVSRRHRGIRPPPGVTLHTARETIPAHDIVERHGMRVCAPARAIVETAGSGAGVHALAGAIAEALRQGRTNPVQIAEHAALSGKHVAGAIRCAFEYQASEGGAHAGRSA